MRLVVFDWDDGNWPKCGQHGVSKEDIEHFFVVQPTVRPDPHEAESRLRAIGPDGNGRHLFVVFTLRRREGLTYIRPISARFMHRKEVQRYEKDSPQTATLVRN